MKSRLSLSLSLSLSLCVCVLWCGVVWYVCLCMVGMRRVCTARSAQKPVVYVCSHCNICYFCFVLTPPPPPHTPRPLPPTATSSVAIQRCHKTMHTLLAVSAKIAPSCSPRPDTPAFHGFICFPSLSVCLSVCLSVLLQILLPAGLSFLFASFSWATYVYLCFLFCLSV